MNLSLIKMGALCSILLFLERCMILSSLVNVKFEQQVGGVAYFTSSVAPLFCTNVSLKWW